MKFLIVLACVSAVIAAEVTVLRNEAEVNPESFKYGYEFDNTIKADQQGVLKDDAWVVSGEYSYISPEGEKVVLNYIADENGYRVNSANPALPTPPPIPEAILRSIKYIEANAGKA